MHHRMTYNPTDHHDATHPVHRSLLIAHRSAFTLVELMVSIAMVVLLLFGIHQVFRMSSNTIGAGQALNAVSRTTRAAQTVMQEDFRRALKDSPLFIISSQPAGARVDPSLAYSSAPQFNTAPRLPFHFLSRAERERDNDDNPATIDRDGDGTEETSYTTQDLARVNDRIHRADIVGFFARGLFTRQTANDGSYVSPTTAFDAWISYGHTRLPDSIAGGYHDPGVVPPGNLESPNQYAANWVLGRRAILFKDPASIAATSNDIYIDPMKPTIGNGWLSPLAYNSAVSTGQNGARVTTEQFAPNSGPLAGSGGGKAVSMLRDSRLDIAGITLENYRGNLLDTLQAWNSDTTPWWHPLVFRYECDPRVRKPLTSSHMAKTTPFFVGNVSQFLVEFAGDFVSQNNTQFLTNGNLNPAYGLVTDFGPDGVIDFIMLASDPLEQTNPSYPMDSRIRKTRWYGLPRDSNGDGMVTGYMTGNANAMPDVVPVSAVLASRFGPGTGSGPWDGDNATRALFEHWFPDNSRHKGEKGFSRVLNPTEFRYVCVWTNDAPAMIRVVMKLEDDAARLPDGQWVEFVLDSP